MMTVYEPVIHRGILTDHFGGPMSEHLGLALHVAETNGSLHHYFAGTVAPNRKSATWWVAKNGRIEQYVPSHMTAWAQADGNGTYNSVETEGFSTEEFTLFQLAGLAFLMRRGHDKFKWPYSHALHPGQRGMIEHSAGGEAWGGHECPGALRGNEIPTICAVAEGVNVVPHGKRLASEVAHFKRHHGLPDTSTIGPRVRQLLSL